MCIDIVDILRFKTGIIQRKPRCTSPDIRHAALGIYNVIAVEMEPLADSSTPDMCAALTCSSVLKYDKTAPRHNENPSRFLSNGRDACAGSSLQLIDAKSLLAAKPTCRLDATRLRAAATITSASRVA